MESISIYKYLLLICYLWIFNGEVLKNVDKN